MNLGRIACTTLKMENGAECDYWGVRGNWYQKSQNNKA